MTPLTRWKLACALLAVVAGHAVFFRGGGGAPDAHAPAAARRGGALPERLRRPLRVSPEAAGVSRAELVERLLAARSLRDVHTLAAKLGAVGDDEAIEQLMPLLDDPRRGVPEAMLGAFGQIGTARAVEVLAARTRDDRPRIRDAAIVALGATRSEAAEKVLLERAARTGDPSQGQAISALGAIGSERAVAALVRLARTGGLSESVAAVHALGRAGTPGAAAALRELVDAQDARIAAAALSSMEEIDEQLLPRLTRLVKTGDSQLATAALGALAKVGEAGLPALREAVFRGSGTTRWAAVASIGEIGSPAAVELLGEILENGDRDAAQTAATMLATHGGPEARALLIQAALSERGRSTGALLHLTQMEGEDVDQALLGVIEDGSPGERRAVLPRLLGTGNPAAVDLAIQLAATGGRSERREIMHMLADSGVPRARDALIDLAGRSRGPTRIGALEALAQARPSDPAIGQLLGDSLFSGRSDEARQAAAVLGRLGTDDARQALITALGDPDRHLAVAAANALRQTGLTDAVKTALISAARDNPEIKQSAMGRLLAAGAPEGLRLAEELLDGADAGGASSAVAALARHETPEARRLIDRALASSEARVRMAAIDAVGRGTGDAAAEKLVPLTRDGDPSVRASAMHTLGQIGSEKAQAALIEAARHGATEDRVAAISGLSSVDDPRASRELAQLFRDRDPQVAQMAIQAATRGGPEVDQALIRLVNDPGASADLRAAAAGQLRDRGAHLDDATEQTVTGLAGPGGVVYLDIE